MDQKHDHGEVRLGLGLGLDYGPEKRDHDPQTGKKRKSFLGLSIQLHPTDDDDDDDDCKSSTEYSRKKLRLTKDQITLLEDNFKLHTTLNMAQKQSLAEKLNLKPRQVEVWFQNRRARTKLKKTEVDCELLKKKCERLSEENWRLKKELLELRASMKMEKPPQFLHHNQKKAGGRPEEEVVVHIVDESN